MITRDVNKTKTTKTSLSHQRASVYNETGFTKKKKNSWIILGQMRVDGMYHTFINIMLNIAGLKCSSELSKCSRLGVLLIHESFEYLFVIFFSNRSCTLTVYAFCVLCCPEMSSMGQQTDTTMESGTLSGSFDEVSHCSKPLNRYSWRAKDTLTKVDVCTEILQRLDCSLSDSAKYSVTAEKSFLTLGPNAINFKMASIVKSTVKIMFRYCMTCSNSSDAL